MIGFSWRWTRGVLLLLMAAFFVVGAWLPSASGGLFASPDETATAVIAESIASRGHASRSEPLAAQVPWLHPRSWVSAGTTIVPVGFLGFPMLLSVIVFFGGTFLLPWLGLFLMTSAIYPVFRLFARRFSEPLALVGSALLFFFPTVVLYANRGLFATGPQLACLVWWLFFVGTAPDSGRSGLRTVLSSLMEGMLTMAILFIRPVEALWLVPWMVWWLQRSSRTWSFRERLAIGVGAGLFLVLYFLVVTRTYGNPLAIGYLLRDNPAPLLSGMLPVVTSQSVSMAFGWEKFLPYGFHPRHMWWNMHSFTREILWPWLLALFAVFAALVSVPTIRQTWRTRFSQTKLRTIVVPVLLALWTIVVLGIIYGSGLYADHIQPGAITIANSFLRYLLPLVPLWVYLLLRLFAEFPSSSRWQWGKVFLTVILLVVGLWTVFAKDDEGLLATRRELTRYQFIRTEASTLLPPETIVLSERSDKIFFPLFRVVSPLPPLAERVRLTQIKGISLALFARPLSQEERDAWRALGVVPQERASFGRERLYALVPLSP